MCFQSLLQAQLYPLYIIEMKTRWSTSKTTKGLQNFQLKCMAQDGYFAIDVQD
jgi:hypothetical protein